MKIIYGAKFSNIVVSKLYFNIYKYFDIFNRRNVACEKT